MTRELESSTIELLASLPPDERETAIRETAREIGVDVTVFKAGLADNWLFLGRPKQQPPRGAWTYWWLRSGRGFGKTLTGAQWAKKEALSMPMRFALIAPTQSDVRRTMVEGETGLLSILPNEALFGQSREHAWNKTSLELTLANRTVFYGYSSEKPDRIRGPQHHKAWCEEISSWKDAAKGDVKDTTWSNAKFSTRLGDNPQFVITSTPKPNKLTKELLKIAAPRMRLVTGSSYENRANLSEAWWQEVIAPYEGTRTARQEIMGELLTDVEGALWTGAVLDAIRVREAPPQRRIVIAVDPNASSEEGSNAAGIIVVGIGHSDERAYVLQDRTVVRGGPRAWASAAVNAYHDWEADKIVAEKNNGGEMVELTIHGVDGTVPVKLVSASRGKRTRAEPVATLYEINEDGEPKLNPETGEPLSRVRHVAFGNELDLLHEEMTTWTPDAESPDRMDALVWGITELALWKPPPSGVMAVPEGRIPGVDEYGRSESPIVF